MGRAGVPTLWHSRLKLGVSSAVLLVLILFIDLRGQRIFEERERKTAAPIKDNLLDDLDDALEYLQYMADLQKGKAFIRNVVEKESSVQVFYWSCSLKPPLEIKEGWIENDDLHLYSAYYDDRPNSLYPRNDVIQVLAMSYRSIDDDDKLYCNIHSGRKSAVVEAYVREIWQRAWDPRDTFYIPNLITCSVPSRLRGLSEYSVSLSNTSCTSKSQAIRVTIPKKPEKMKTLAICVKGMDFQEDISVRLVEWIEAQLMYGADQITMYSYTVSNRTQLVLDHYVGRGVLKVIPLNLPGDSPNIPFVRSSYIWRNRQQKRRHELIPYNDCLYRHLHTHRYILILDTDEVVVPLRHGSYEKLLEEVQSNDPKRLISSISVRNVFKFPTKNPDETAPEYLHLLRNQHRSSTTSGKGVYSKSFTSTANVASVFNHFALHRLSGTVVPTIHLPEEVAVKLHYKEKCPVESQKECPELQGNTVIDHSLDPKREELTKRVETTLRTLTMLPQS